MNCPDIVMSAVSYHSRHRDGAVARAYWQFVADWQDHKGGLHRPGGQWYLLELASRFPFRTIRQILVNSLPLAARRQKKGGGFRPEYPGGSACETLLAYSRHEMLERLLAELRYDPLPLVAALDAPLGIKTRRLALGQPRHDDCQLSERLIESIRRQQEANGSWQGLILATAAAIHDLLDCGLSAEDEVICSACEWLLAQQRRPDKELFPEAEKIPTELSGMFYTGRIREETAFERRRHPEYRGKREEGTCLSKFPIYQTGTALAALCRAGITDRPEVKRGFADLFRIRGPGGKPWPYHWCGCHTGRWLRTNAPKFGRRID